MVKSPGPVVIMPGALDRLTETVRAVAPTNRVVVITDTTVGELLGLRIAKTLAAELLLVPAGEAYKTRATWQRLTDEMLERELGRDTTIVALGGGVVGDLAGFVAATYMRGVPVVQVPTTLLAMVDASIGGKTGVDTHVGKNLVGAFHQPSAVMIDPLVLQTLPVQHLRAGFAEVIKHGAVADADYFLDTISYLRRSPLGENEGLTGLTPIIERSVAIKSDVVARDERESGIRKILNFGHTIGHAIEAACVYRLLHGECVAIGMVLEARVAEAIGVATKGTAAAVQEACELASLPIALPDVDRDDVMRFMRSDKKARSGRLEFALLARVGEMAGADTGWAVPVDEKVVMGVLSG